MLKSYLKEEHEDGSNEVEVALAHRIVSMKLLYKKVRGRYTLLNIRSIITYLRTIKTSVINEIREEQKPKTKLKREKKRGFQPPRKK